MQIHPIQVACKSQAASKPRATFNSQASASPWFTARAKTTAGANIKAEAKITAPAKIKAGARIKSNAGFTLLEVIVALTITGFILGGLLSLVAGSKRLAWTSEASLIRAARLRAATNFALLQNEFSDVELILENYDYEARAGELLEEPLRKTEASVFSLQFYEISNDERDERVTGSRWIRMELPK